MFFYSCYQFEDFMWKEEDGSTPSEKNMARVARQWYQSIQENPRNMPYAKFRACLVEQKVSKREAYQRLIEAGGGKVVKNSKDCNIVIGDGPDAVAVGENSNVPVKAPMFLNDVILSFNSVDFLSFD